MKKLLWILFILGAGMGVGALSAQTPTLMALPAATQHQVNLTWKNTCSSTLSCSFVVFRAAGTCPAAGAVAWLNLSTTAASAVAYSDLAVTQGGQYSYTVESQAMVDVISNGVTTPTLETSAPSNCTTVTVPNGPSPATGVIATAS